MKLWLLERISNNPEYDVLNGLVIRAETETDARAMAAKEKQDEGAETWLRSQSSTCVELTADGPAEVILTDINAG